MLLTTKFLQPSTAASAIRRSHLFGVLQPRQTKRLNLVVAPAGFGKTTLVSQWCAQTGGDVAWYSIDENDNNPRRFWLYVAGTLNHAGVAGLDDTINLINSVDAKEFEGVITRLLNVLAQLSRPLTLVLDDFHLAQNPEIQRQFSYFIDYLPPGLMVTITSRIEPELPLARWRVRQWLDEVHPSMLAFSEEECQAFFRNHMSLTISDASVRDIWQQTEGWVAAMQLSALSAPALHNSASKESTVIQLDGRQINDYVFTEVLALQSAEVRQFLIDTSCCPRLCAPLCDAVREADDSQQLLERLLKNNLFLIPLDNDNTWFRYHDLFRDALVQRAQQDSTTQLKERQKKAIEWLLENDHLQEAIIQIVHHENWPWLATVLEKHGNHLIHRGFHLPVLEWLQHIPSAMCGDRPQLMMLRIWALFFSNRLELIEAHLGQLEHILDQSVADNHPNAEIALSLNSEISVIRSHLARTRQGDKSASDLAQRALREIDHSRIPLKSVTYYGLGLDYFGNGELPEAEEALRSSVHYGEFERQPSTVLSSGGLLAWIQYNRGDIDQALDTCANVRAWVDKHFYDPAQPRLISCWQNSALVQIYRERNESELALSYLAPLLEHLSDGTEPGQHVIIQYVRGHLAFSNGDYTAAIDALEDAEATGRRKRDHIAFEPPASGALLARCYLATGEIARAESWVQAQASQLLTNPLNREQCAISTARVFNATKQPQRAIEQLTPLLASIEAGQHYRHLIEVLAVYAEALYLSGDSAGAGKKLEEALKLAAEAGYLRLFAEESSTVQLMILQSSAIKSGGRWHTQLGSMLEESAQHAPKLPETQLVEPLSQRESEVLRLIYQGLSNKDIAEHMEVAPTTVKAHIRNLYSKLGVGSRTEALAKARDLALL